VRAAHPVPVAAFVLLPFGLGYLVGTVGGGWLLGWLGRVLPTRDRIAYLQVAQLGFAFFGTQFHC
jgi:hypothetical protein